MRTDPTCSPKHPIILIQVPIFIIKSHDSNAVLSCWLFSFSNFTMQRKQIPPPTGGRGLRKMHMRKNLFHRSVFFDYKILHNEPLTFHSIITHIICQNLLYLFVLVDFYLFQSDLRANKSSKLFWRYFAKSFKSSYFWFCPQFCNCFSALLFIIAISRNIVIFVAVF